MATMEAAEKRRTSLSPVSGTYLLGAVRALEDLLGESLSYAAPCGALWSGAAASGAAGGVTGDATRTGSRR